MADTILVVDDDADVLNMLNTFLKTVGYRVDTAEGVDAAIKLLDTDHYDIMLIDKNMPGIDGNREGGIDLLKHVRSQSQSGKVIMMTGSPTAEFVKEILKFGASDYIYKPFFLEDLRVKIRTILDKK